MHQSNLPRGYDKNQNRRNRGTHYMPRRRKLPCCALNPKAKACGKEIPLLKVFPSCYLHRAAYDDKPAPYIGTFLVGKDKNGHFRETHEPNPIVSPGYRYIEAVDPKDGKRYRYTGSIKVVGRKLESAPNVQVELSRNPNYDLNIYGFVVDRDRAPHQAPRYGVTYDDISTPEERDFWIAGSSLKVIDLQTNEIIAERIGYMIDFAQGATPGGRQPWTFAKKNDGWSCPALKGQSYGARRFVEKVLLIRDAQPIIPPDLPRQAAPVR